MILPRQHRSRHSTASVDKRERFEGFDDMRHGRKRSSTSGNRSGSGLPGAVLALLAAGAEAGYDFESSDDILADAAALPGWSATLERHAAERVLIQHCLAQHQDCSGKLKSLGFILSKAAELDSDRQLRLVNRWVNRRRYRRDRRAPSASVTPGGSAELKNHWSTLLEFLDRGGDCEDYAVAKYFMLRELGIPAEDMRILVTWEKQARDYHAVLAVRRNDGSVRLLETDDTIVRGSPRRYRFIYAVNEQRIWDHDKKARRKSGGKH